MQISFNPEAEAEAKAAALYYRTQGGSQVADEFSGTLRDAIALIRERPAMGTPGNRRTRRMILKRFPYSVVYRIDGEHIRILAVAHQHRRPGYWAQRL